VQPLFFFISVFGSALFLEAKEKHNISIAIFDSPATHQHSQKVIRLFEKQLKNCKTCEFKLFPIFKNSGEISIEDFVNGLREAKAQAKVIHISWNLAYEPRFEPVIQELNLITASGLPVVGASGESQEKSMHNLSIDQTVLGKVNGIILVGELDQKGKLSSRSFYGPSILAAFSGVRDFPGSSFTSVLVSSKIATGHSQNWYEHFKKVKKQSSRSWPLLSEYF